MDIENLQVLPPANYNTDVGADEIIFLKIGNGFDATFPIEDISTTAIHISIDEIGQLPIGTTDISELEPNQYEEEDPIEDASLEIQSGSVEIFNDNTSVPNQRYALSEMDVAVEIVNGVMTAYTKRKGSA